MTAATAAPDNTCLATDGAGGGRMFPSVLMSASCLSSSSVMLEVGRTPIIPYAHENYTRTSMVRQIVGKRADGLANTPRRIPLHGFFPFHEVGFEVRHQRFEFSIGICVGHVGASIPAGCSANSSFTLVTPTLDSHGHGSRT